jgi:outer membrane protein OmpA-like peptidoglycan-associated protein
MYSKLQKIKVKFVKIIFDFWMFLLLNLAFSFPVFAQDPPQEGADPGPGEIIKLDQKSIEKRNMSLQIGERYFKKDHSVGTGFALFLGIDSGYILSKSISPEDISDKSGFSVGGKIVASVYPEYFVFDLGLGWFYSILKGTERYLDPKTNRRDTYDSKVSIVTYAALTELSARLRLFHALQIGPTFQGFFGTDVSFRSDVHPESFTAFGGGQLFYGIPDKTGDLRFGLTYLVSLNAPEAQVHQIIGSIQLGLPIVRPDEIYKEKSLSKLTKKTEIKEVPKTNLKIITKDVVKFVVDRSLLPFKDNRALLSPEMQRFLSELALTLKSVNDTFQEVAVEGHTARVPGNTEENFIRLSSSRAAAVRNALVANGIPVGEAKSRGMGTSRLYQQSAPDSLVNERIELSFSGVSNAGRLNEALSQLQKSRLKPETCSDEGCK